MGRTLAALNLAAIIGATGTFLEDSRRNRRRSISAQDKADEALTMAEDWMNSADRIRLVDPKVRDYIAGLSYPSQPESDTPSAYPTTPTLIARPYMNEDEATTPTSYPPAVNLYDAYGRFVNPSDAQQGENFLHGLVQNYGELRAADLGATFEGVPNKAKLQHIFRHHRGLMQALVDLESVGISQSDAKEAWLRFYDQTVSRGSTVLWRVMEDSPVLSASGSFLTFTLPANYLQIGDTAILYWTPMLPAGLVNVDFTPQVHLGDLSGPTLWSPYASLNPNNLGLLSASLIDCQMRITRRSDDPTTGNARFAIGGHLVCGSGTVQGGMGLSGTVNVVQFNHSIDQQIALTGTFSAPMSVRITEGKFIRET